MPLPVLALLLLASPVAQEPAASERSELARVPFRSEFSLILVEVRVAGELLTLLLDTGASGTVIESSVAERLGVQMGPETPAGPSSSGETLFLRPIRELAVEVGGHVAAPTRAIAVPCQGLVQMMLGVTAHGILGHTFIQQFAIEIDYEERVLVLHDPAKYRYEGEGAEIPLTFARGRGNLPLAKVVVDGGGGEPRELQALVDTGGSTMTTLGMGKPGTADSVLPPDAPRVPMMGATGLGNSPEEILHKTFATRLASLRIGPYEIERPTSSFSDAPHGFDLFGSELLRRFDVVLDYARSRMILTPNESFDEPPLSDCSGMMLVAAADDVSVRRVLFVVPGGPADEAGLQKGDELVSIDGEPASAGTLNELRRALLAPIELELVVARGDERFETTLRARELL